MNEKKKKHILREIGEILFALLVAWLGFHALALATGSSLPIVAVVSDSMYHDQKFDSWWTETKTSAFYERMSIDKQRFENFPFRNGLSKGDLLLVFNNQPRVGDVVIYTKPEQGISIVHRVIGINGNTYTIKGDNNYAQDQPDVTGDRIIGKVVFAVPLLGYPRFLLFAFGV